MALKTDYLIGVLNDLEAQAANRAPANELIAAIRSVKNQVEARKTLGEDPNTAGLPAIYASVSSAVAAFNAVMITIPTEAEIAAGVAAADSVTTLTEE